MLKFIRSNTWDHMSAEDRDMYQRSKDEWRNYPPLSNDEIVARLTVGDTESVIYHNMRLVCECAAHWTGRGLSFDDLVQEGAIGLMRAIEKYDPERGTNLTTMATQWINQACQRAIENTGSAIRVPVHVKTSRSAKVARLRAWANRASNITSGDKTIQSLGNSLYGSSANKTVFDRTPDDSEPYINADNHVMTEAALATLNPIERMVIELFYLHEVDLPTIGQRLGVSRQRVFQIKDAALARMRAALVGEVAA